MNRDELSEYSQLFYDDGYKLGKQAAAEFENETPFLPFIEKMYHSIDKFIESISALALKQGISIDCKKGCSWCCHQAVYANSYEIQYLKNYIKNSFSKEDQLAVLDLAKKKNKVTGKMSKKDVLHFKNPCPLLKNNRCTAYKARPMACRIYLSTKVSTCFEFYKNPGNKENFPALMEFPLKAGRMMNEGFIDALLEKEIFVSEFRIEEGLEMFLSPDNKY